MVVWPLGYLRVDLLTTLVGIALLSLLFYRVSLYLFGVIAVTLVVRVVKGIRRFGES